VTADPKLLDKLSRDELIARATELDVKRPELLTRFELRDEILRLSTTDVGQGKRVRGWFGVARDLVASVVEQGLNLPDAADVIRGGYVPNGKPVPPVATVTLAEIYAAQGHVDKALALLDEVLSKEPEHSVAEATRLRLRKEREPRGGAGRTSQASPPPVENVEKECLVESPPELPDVEVLEAEPISGIQSSAVASPDDTCAAQTSPDDTCAAEPSTDDTCAAETSPDETCAAEPSTDETCAAETSPDETCAAETSTAEPITADTCMVEVVPPLPEPPPARDLLVVVRVAQGRACASWELTEETLRLLEDEGRLPLCLHVVQLRGTWDGPVESHLRLAVEARVGQAWLEASEVEIVRAAMGWEKGERFFPLLVGAELRLRDDGEPAVAFRPPQSLSAEDWQLFSARAVTRVLALAANS
jgi:hypothetical protein